MRERQREAKERQQTLDQDSQPPVEPAEGTSEQDRKDQDARPEDKDVLGLAQFEVPYSAHKQIADSKVEEAPQDIDRRGRQPYPGRGREGTLEGMARDAIAEMG